MACIFCSIVDGETSCYKVYEDNSVLAFFDINMGADFHTLVIPKKHTPTIFEISKEDLRVVADTVKHISQVYKKELGIHNVNIIQSNGKYAGQEISHFHIHLLPRSEDDDIDLDFDHKKDISRLERNHELLKETSLL